MLVRKGIAPSLALLTLALLAGCGGSSPTGMAPPTGGFSAKNLTGTYVFSSNGLDSQGFSLEIAGTVVANGSGGITGGTIDIVGPDVPFATPVAQAITGGSYTLGADGRGQLKLGIATLDFVLTSSSHGLITEYDNNVGSGSGTIDLQSTVTLAQLAGSYAFSLAGEDASGAPTATVGSFTLDSLGNVTGGVQDFNDDGFTFLAQSVLPGTATLGTGTGPGSITLSTGTFGPLTFDCYPIDATHLKFVETDYVQFLAGDGFTQTGATIPTGKMVFTVAGLDTTGTVAAGGIMTSDGTGNFTNGLEDVNDAGSVSPAQLPFSGTAAPGGAIGGRVVVNMSTFTPATQYVIYPSSGGVLMLETDPFALTTGVAYAQTSQTFAASEGYGLNLSAINTGGEFEEDDIAEFTTTSAGFSGLVDINDQGALSFDQTFSSSSYTPPDSTGRGFAATVEHGNNTFVSYLFYVVNSSTVLLLETDSNQIGIGTLGLQNAASPGGVQPAIAMAHPPVRARGAFRRK